MVDDPEPSNFFSPGFDMSTLEKLNGAPPDLRSLRSNGYPDGRPLDSCEHDWRVDHAIALDTEPLRQYVICARCGACTTRVIPALSSKPHRRSGGGNA